VSNRDGGRDVYAARLDRCGRVTGTPRRVTTGLNALSISVPANGSSIAYAAFSETSNIWWMPAPTGAPGSLDDAHPLTTGSQVIEWFDISRDGRWVVFDSDRTGNSHLYRMALDGKDEPEQLTRDSTDHYYPMWSPDGREIAFHSFRDGRRQLFLMPAEGGPARRVAESDHDDRTATWSPDGRALLSLSNYGAPSVETRIFRRGAAGDWTHARWRKPPCYPAWAPDGNAVACADLMGRLLLTDAEGNTLRVLADSGLIPGMGLFPQWSSDGRTVYYLGADSVSMSISGVPARGGDPRIAVRFDDPARPWHRYGFRVYRDRIYFTLGDRQSHIWVADLEADR
jgi:Tol biopolymer transport system component